MFDPGMILPDEAFGGINQALVERLTEIVLQRNPERRGTSPVTAAPARRFESVRERTAASRHGRAASGQMRCSGLRTGGQSTDRLDERSPPVVWLLGSRSSAPQDAALIERAVTLVELLGGTVATPVEARSILGLARIADTS